MYRRSLRFTRAVLASLVAILVAATTTIAATPAVAAQGKAPTQLTIQGLDDPADVSERSTPKLGWQVSQSRQTAYQVVVASSEKKAKAFTGDVWDSGKVSSAKQTDVAYKGKKLSSDHQYYWAVRTWDGDDTRSNTSRIAQFHTAPSGSWDNAKPVWAQPAATADKQSWTNYTVDADITVDTSALGLYLRAKDSKNALMWQFRSDTNTLVPHKVSGGEFTALEPVDLPAGTLEDGKKTSIKITVSDKKVTTVIGGKQVDTREIDGPAAGPVGVRTGESEKGTVNSLKVKADDGDTLLADDLSSTNPFTCGSTGKDGLKISTGQSCILSSDDSDTDDSDSTDWAFLRTEFTPAADKKIASGTLYATGGNFDDHKQYSYKTYVNGAFAGLGPTKALDKETRFDGFDVTKLLKHGTNAVGALAYTGKEDHQRFQARVDITYTDGSSDSFGSGTDWKGLTGGNVFPDGGSIGTDYYSAPVENADMRKYPTGFAKPGFDDSDWQPAVAKSAFSYLTATPTGKVKQQYKRPVKVVDKGNGDYFVDFGRTWVGGAHYSMADGNAGDEVTLRYGEITNGTNSVKYKLNTGNTYQDSATLRDGEQTVDTWGIRAFRYAEVHNAPEPVTKDNFKALALVYPFDESASSFSSSNSNLNDVYQLSKNTVEATNLNVYTDSWTRERAPYEADSYLQQKSSLYLMNDLSLGKYTFEYFEKNRTWPTEWPLYDILAARDAWKQTGDTDQVKSAYDSLAAKLPDKWVDSSTGLVGKSSGSDGCSSETDCDIVDWPESQRDGYKFAHYNTVVNALSYRAYSNMAELSAAVGKDSDAAAYRKKADRIRKALNDKLYDAKSGAYDDGMSAAGKLTGHHSMHASAFALSFGIPTDSRKDTVADFVSDKGMVCSVYCAGFSLDGLFNSGKDKAAVDQLTSEGTSSWMNMIKLGAGATGEAWDPDQKSNLTFSHPWAASPAFYVPAGLFGIKPKTAGYDSFTVAPKPGGLKHAKVTVPSVKGTIGAAFSHADTGQARVLAQVPGNTKADVSVPLTSDGKTESSKAASSGSASTGNKATEGEKTTVYLDGQAVTASVKDGRATVANVPTGCHILTPGNDKGAFSDTKLSTVCQAENDTSPGSPTASPTSTGGVPTSPGTQPQPGPTTGGPTPSAAEPTGSGSGNGDDGDNSDSSQPGDPRASGDLPFTGATVPLWVAGAAAILIVAGIALYVAARRKRQ